jgi:hypothetical protein
VVPWHAAHLPFARLLNDRMPSDARSLSESPRSVRRLELVVLLVWAAAVATATVQQGIAHQNNNFLIFRAASLHLLHGQDLYAAYPALHTDFYKYSPTFALLFLPLALLPFAAAILVWNALNAAALYLALGTVLNRRGALVARSIVFMDMFGSLQNVQSNALVAALIILTFAGYERRHAFMGSLAAAVGATIKIFPLAGASFAIFHPRKARVAAALAVSMLLLLLVPLLVTPPHTLLAQYASWRAIEAVDTGERGFSVMQMLELLFHRNWPSWPVQLLGVVALVAPLLVRRSRWTQWGFRRLYLCSVLLFCVIFNHQSESPTFVIAVAGAAIWFASNSAPDQWVWGLFAFIVTCTVLASSEAMPNAIQRAVFDRYHFKVVPMIVLWAVLQYQLWKPDQRAGG